jgi:predicted ATPase
MLALTAIAASVDSLQSLPLRAAARTTGAPALAFSVGSLVLSLKRVPVISMIEPLEGNFIYGPPVPASKGLRGFSNPTSFTADVKDEPATAARTNPLKRKSTLNDLDPSLQKAGLAAAPREATAYRRNPKQTAVIRIALTGGPCAGKSSCLAHITETATAAGFDVYRSPETATVLFNAGVQLPLGDVEGMFIFQFSLMRLQLAVERSLTRIAASTGRPSIIIFDRGLLDPKGYMDEATWARVLNELDSTYTDTGFVKKGVTESYLLNRYDGVLHMVTAADGATEYYKYGTVKDDSGNVVIRHETPEKAVALDVKMRECWKAHPNQQVVGNGQGGFGEKLEAAAAVVLGLAKKTHPVEFAMAGSRTKQEELEARAMAAEERATAAEERAMEAEVRAKEAEKALDDVRRARSA